MHEQIFWLNMKNMNMADSHLEHHKSSTVRKVGPYNPQITGDQPKYPVLEEKNQSTGHVDSSIEFEKKLIKSKNKYLTLFQLIKIY